MVLFALAFFGGVLTILSPCILPVLPFVFTKTGEPFRRSGLPLLIGMALTFAVVASLAAVGGGWVVQAEPVRAMGRARAGFGLRRRAVVPERGRSVEPAVRRDRQSARQLVVERERQSAGSSLLLGVATGILWVPCAGPILGLILTGAALRGANVETSLLLLAYAAGSAVSLAGALLLGGKVFAALKRSLGAEEWIRRALGGAVVVGALAIAFGLDTGFLARVSTASTTKLEETLFGGGCRIAMRREDDVLLPGPGMAGNGDRCPVIRR